MCQAVPSVDLPDSSEYQETMRRGIRKSLTRCLLVGLALLLAVPPLPRVQPSAAAAVPLKPQQLEQIVAPIALYPDSLVAHIMMAATYPLEVVQAARFVRANPNLRDDALNEELKKYEWDNSVKALVKFPQVLEMMDGQLEWMQRLGDAVLTQQKEAMDAIQRLRARAQKAGTLKSTQEQKVIVESAPTPTDQTIIKIEPENPEIIYPPAYDPLVVYGPWPYPAYPPYYYYSPYYPLGYATIWFGFGTLVGGSIWGGCNWRVGKFALHVEHHNAFDRHVNRMNVVRPLRVAAGGARGNGVVWQHNPEHRRLVQSRDGAIQQPFNQSGGGTIASREPFRGPAEQGRPEVIRGTGGQGDGAGGRAVDVVVHGQGPRSFSDRGALSRGGSVSTSTFPGNTVSASTFPGNTLSASTFPGNTAGVSTFPGNTSNVISVPGNTFGIGMFPGNTFGGRHFGGGFASGGGRR
jgi:Protein of unknown function (DUF3300)